MKTRNTLDKKAISYIAQLAFRRTGAMVLAFMALLGGSSVNLIFPEVLRRYLSTGDLATLARNLPLLAGILATLFVFQGISFFFRSYLFNRIGLEVVSEVRRELFTAILHREASFFDSAKATELAARVNADAALVQDLVSVRISVVARYLVQMVLGTALMAWMSWRLTAALIASVLVMVGASFFFIRHLRRASRDYQGALSLLTSFVSEAFSNAKLTKALHAEEWATNHFDRINRRRIESVYNLGIRRGIISAGFTSGASLLLNLLMIAVVWYGVSLLASGVLELGQFTAFALYGAIVAVSFSFLISSYSEVVQALGGIERIIELINTPSIEHAHSAKREKISALAAAPSAVEIQDLSFYYASSGSKPILRIPRLQIGIGERCAILGPSGTGKSSLVNLILGMYPPTKGKIRVFGRDIESYPRAELATLVSWVPQDTTLFGFTIFENLTLGFDRLTRSEVESKLKGWSFMNFINELPNGLDTVLGDGGVQLSGGQRQRISIARAVLRKPELLILDEATSGLDSDTESELLSTIQTELLESTLIIISHRLSTARIANRVVVLNQGEVAQDGTHDTLKVVPGLYQRYIEHQAVS